MSIAAASCRSSARDAARLADVLLRRLVQAASRRVLHRAEPGGPSSCSGPCWSRDSTGPGKFGPADVTIVWLTLVAYNLGDGLDRRLYQSDLRCATARHRPARRQPARAGICRRRHRSCLQFEPITVRGSGPSRVDSGRRCASTACHSVRSAWHSAPPSAPPGTSGACCGACSPRIGRSRHRRPVTGPPVRRRAGGSSRAFIDLALHRLPCPQPAWSSPSSGTGYIFPPAGSRKESAASSTPRPPPAPP